MRSGASTWAAPRLSAPTRAAAGPAPRIAPRPRPPSRRPSSPAPSRCQPASLLGSSLPQPLLRIHSLSFAFTASPSHSQPLLRFHSLSFAFTASPSHLQPLFAFTASPSYTLSLSHPLPHPLLHTLSFTASPLPSSSSAGASDLRAPRPDRPVRAERRRGLRGPSALPTRRLGRARRRRALPRRHVPRAQEDPHRRRPYQGWPPLLTFP